MDSAKKLLDISDNQEKTRTSFNLKRDQYKAFKEFCENRGITTSRMLDALIQDFLKEQITNVN